jgi:hypothetical protein
MSDAERYRENAEACLLFAGQTDDEQQRLTWRMMAVKWLQWAREEEASTATKRAS